MDNTNIILAANILKFRKKNAMTQEELADKLGVTFQAVSKWENAKSAPDILLLPMMADLFGCYIDELFSREIQTEIHYDHCPEFPWNDDEVIRGVVCQGKKILQVTEGLVNKFTFEIIGDAKNVKSECNVSVSGSVSGGCNVGGEVTIGGHLSGGCNAGGDVILGGHLSGGCCCGDVTCGGNFSGEVICNGLTVNGDVEAETIKGDVICNSLKCDRIEGDVTINKWD